MNWIRYSLLGCFIIVSLLPSVYASQLSQNIITTNQLLGSAVILAAIGFVAAMIIVAQTQSASASTTFIVSGVVAGGILCLGAVAVATLGPNLAVNAPPTGTIDFPPNAPFNLLAHAVATNQINLSWSAPTGGTLVQGYQIEHSLDNISWVIVTSNTGSTNTVYNDTTLSPGSTYYFRVSSVNVAGVSPPSNVAQDTTFGAPDPPTNLSATATLTSEIDLTWTAPAFNGGNPITSYRIDRATGTGSFSTINPTAPNATSYQDTGLQAGTSYTYRVFANNNILTSTQSNNASATTFSPTVNFFAPTGNVTNIATCPSRTVLLTAANTIPADVNLLIAQTQFSSTSGSGHSINVGLFQSGNSQALVNNTYSIRLNAQVTSNAYTLLFKHSATANPTYTVEACTTAGSADARARLVVMNGMTNSAWARSNSISFGPADGDKTIQQVTTTLPAGNNVVLAMVANNNGTSASNTILAGAIKIKNNGGSTIASNEYAMHAAPNAPTVNPNLLLIGLDSGAGANPTYTLTTSSANNTRMQATMLVLQSPQSFFIDGTSTSLGTTQTPLATLNTAFAANNKIVVVGTMQANNTASSIKQISPNQLQMQQAGSTVTSSAFAYRSFFKGGSFGDTFSGGLLWSIGNATASPIYVMQAAANASSSIVAESKIIAFQVSATASTNPTALKTNTISTSEIDTLWTAPSSNGGHPITGYCVYRETPTGGGFSQRACIGNTTSYADTGINQNTQYNYKVLAQNSAGNSTFSAASANYTIPNANTLTATALNYTTIKINMSPQSGTVLGYKIDRSTDNISFATIVSNTGNSIKNYNDTGLSSNTAYYYRTFVIGNGGTSVASNVANATTPSATSAYGSGSAIGNIATCAARTQILTLNPTMPAGSNILLANVDYASDVTGTKTVTASLYNGANLLGQNVLSLRLSGNATSGSYLLIGNQTNAPANPTYTVEVCTSGAANSVRAKAQLTVINGFANFAFAKGVSTALSADVDTTVTTIPTTLPAGNNLIIASTHYSNGATNTNIIGKNFVKIIDNNNSRNVGNNTMNVKLGTAAPTSSPPFGIIGYEVGAPANPTYLVTMKVHNTTANGQATVYVIQPSKVVFTDGSIQTLALQPTQTTMATASTTYSASVPIVAVGTSMFNNTGSTIKAISSKNYTFYEGSTLKVNNTFAMRSFFQANFAGDSFQGNNVYSTSSAASSPSYTIKASANTTSAIKGQSKLAVFQLSGTLPGAPTGVNATELNRNSTTIVWNTPTSDGGSTITGYKIEMQLNNTSTWSTVIANTGVVNTYNTNNDRLTGLHYSYRVSAINSVGTGTPSTVTSLSKINPLDISIFYSSCTGACVTLDFENMMKARFGQNDSINNFRMLQINKVPNAGGWLLYCSVDHLMLVNECGNSPGIYPSFTNWDDFLQSNWEWGNQSATKKAQVRFMGYDPEQDNSNLSTPCCRPPPTGTGLQAGSEIDTLAVSANKAATQIHTTTFKVAHTPTFANMLTEYQQVNWAKVDIANWQTQAHTTDADFVTNVHTVSSWIKTNSSGHTIFCVQYNPTKDTMAHLITQTTAIRADIDCVNFVAQGASMTAPLLGQFLDSFTR